ncbi:outer membrane protein OmpA-like peptidoglycan-associated protein [Halomonas campaniensis]|uniref:Outer membrane protein OmpA-like peptidoglycan-associated protein n=1 Tax=Halomonas campaniensis TaxID=213554 RepID=A0A7W5K5U5_9GAMM|nr:OmpA family protein [Halomonas campaniensis]MBB3332521.1 outer membrane protein OmpA-like peptidoglycan-associated protein [Halomonas campaniensis]
MMRFVSTALLCAALAGCNAATLSTAPSSPPAGATLVSQGALIEQEHRDRIQRIRRLAEECDVPPPSVDQQLLLPRQLFATDRDLPVIRVAWSDRIFFATDQATPLATSEPMLCVVAGVMKGDLPDTHLAVVGHTDARGSEAYNDALSLARARNVTDRLVELGVRSQQMDYIGMGELQPVAPNSTSLGMAQNRRVEFFLGAFSEITLEAVSRVPVEESYRRLAERPLRERRVAEVGAERQVTVHAPASRQVAEVGTSREVSVDETSRRPDAGEPEAREITVGGRERSLNLPAVVYREPAIGSRRTGF